MRTSVDVRNFLLEREVPHELVPVRGRLRSPDTRGGRPRAASGTGGQGDGRGREQAPGRRPPSLRPRARTSGDSAVAVRSPSLTELSPDEVADATEYLAEVVPPVGLPDDVRVVMDRRLVDEEVLYFAGGETSILLKIRPDDLVRASGAKVAKVSR